MLRSLYLSMVYGVFLCAGIVAPFVMGLGYVWVDIFYPQKIAYSMLTDIPVSAIMGAAAIGAYVLMDRRAPPRPNLIMVLIVAMAVWVTITTFYFAVAPEAAWFKFNWAIKTIIFSAFMPFLFRSRVQIEAFLQVYIFSAAIQIIPYGVKTMLSGGSYHANLGLLSGNSGLAEGSTLSSVAILSVPLVLWLRRHSLIIPRMALTKLMYAGLAVAAVAASIGTFERTGLVAMGVLGAALWLQSKYKFRYLLLSGVGLVVVGMILLQRDGDWVDRMSTITTFNQESSAFGRILVWKWTLEFVRTHPFGGGFNSFYVNSITFPSADGTAPLVVHGKAFHSMYFEMLGEHGWLGLSLLLSLLSASAVTLYRIQRVCEAMDEMEWCRDLAASLMISLAIVVVCGAFIGIAFQTEVYYTFAVTAMLAAYVRRARVLAGLQVERTSIAGVPLGEPVYG